MLRFYLKLGHDHFIAIHNSFLTNHPVNVCYLMLVTEGVVKYTKNKNNYVARRLWAGHMAPMGEKRGAVRIFVGKP